MACLVFFLHLFCFLLPRRMIHPSNPISPPILKQHAVLVHVWEKKLLANLGGTRYGVKRFLHRTARCAIFLCHFNFQMELVLVYFLCSFVHQNDMLWRSHPLMHMLQYIFEPRGISNVNTWFCSLHAWSRMTEQRLTGGWLMSVGELMTTANIHSSVFLQVHLSRAEFQNA